MWRATQGPDYLDGELDPRTATFVEGPVRWCPNCRRMLANLRRAASGLGALRDLPTLADEPQG